MAIIMPARDDVPVQMRCHVTETGVTPSMEDLTRRLTRLDADNPDDISNPLARIEIGMTD